MSNVTIETDKPAAAVQPETETKQKKPAKGARAAKKAKPAKKAKAAKKVKPAAKKSDAKPAAERSNKKAEVLALMKRSKGANRYFSDV